MEKVHMLTTFDNPFNPFEDFKSWFMFDSDKGYNSCGLIDRLGNFSEDLTEHETYLETERVIDKIIKLDPFNIYTKIEKDTNISTQQNISVQSNTD